MGSAGQQTAAAAFFATKRQQHQSLLVKPAIAPAKLPDTMQQVEKKKETVSSRKSPVIHFPILPFAYLICILPLYLTLIFPGYLMCIIPVYLTLILPAGLQLLSNPCPMSSSTPGKPHQESWRTQRCHWSRQGQYTESLRATLKIKSL